jgi:hypothetical protein
MAEIVSMNENDVLCGRGGATNNYIGNKRFRSIVACHQGEYLKAKKKDKVRVSQAIVRAIRESGGRFLRRVSEGLWVEVGDKKATEKTSQALREGLDVRAITLGKAQRCSSEGSSDTDEDTPRKKRRIEKKEAVHPPSDVRLLSMEAHSMPDLEDETPRLMPNFFFPELQPLSPSDCNTIAEI